MGKLGDGHDGWQENAPYDRIMVTAMTNSLPLGLVNQLKVTGKMILPLNGNLCLVTKTGPRPTFETKPLIGVRFVPLVEGISARLTPTK